MHVKGLPTFVSKSTVFQFLDNCKSVSGIKAPFTYPDKRITGYFLLRLGVAFIRNKRNESTYPVKFLSA